MNPGSKAALKPPHSKRWRDCPAPANRAKRLECGGFSAAFRWTTIFRRFRGSMRELLWGILTPALSHPMGEGESFPASSNRQSVGFAAG